MSTQSPTTDVKMTHDYNEHSILQANTANPAVELIQKILQNCKFHYCKDKPFVICEYGCSGGRNSIIPIKTIIETISKENKEQLFTVYLNDTPTNNFSVTFNELNGKFNENTYLFAIGKSFFEQICHSGSVHFGYSLTAAHWINLPFPSLLDGKIVVHNHPKAEIRELWKKRAADQWKQFLMNRAKELAPGGRLLISGASRNDKIYTCQGAYEGFSELWLKLLQEGKITKQIYAAVNVPVYYRDMDEWLEPILKKEVPFELDESVKPFITHIQCPYYEQYKKDGDLKKYGTSLMGAFKAVTDELLQMILSKLTSCDQVEIIKNELWKRFEEYSCEHPGKCTFDNLAVFLPLKKV